MNTKLKIEPQSAPNYLAESVTVDTAKYNAYFFASGNSNVLSIAYNNGATPATDADATKSELIHAFKSAHPVEIDQLIINVPDANAYNINPLHVTIMPDGSIKTEAINLNLFRSEKAEKETILTVDVNLLLNCNSFIFWQLPNSATYGTVTMNARIKKIHNKVVGLSQ